MIVYLAAPFFTPEQLGIIPQVELTIEAAGHQLLSPRRRGPILKDLEGTARKMAAEKVFVTNVSDLEASDCVVAVIDDRDAGTMWEMGYAYSRGKRIYSFTNKDYGLNVMIQGCVKGHARGIAQLALMMKRLKDGDPLGREFSVEAAT